LVWHCPGTASLGDGPPPAPQASTIMGVTGFDTIIIRGYTHAVG
jgi:hypothetical protein